MSIWRYLKRVQPDSGWTCWIDSMHGSESVSLQSPSGFLFVKWKNVGTLFAHLAVLFWLEFYRILWSAHSLSKLKILKWVVSRNLWNNVSAFFLGTSTDIPCAMISSQVNWPCRIQCFLGNTGNTNHCQSKSNNQKGVPLRNASAKPSRGSNDSPGKFVREVQGIESSHVPREIFLQEGNVVAGYLTSLHDFTSAFDPSW